MKKVQKAQAVFCLAFLLSAVIRPAAYAGPGTPTALSDTGTEAEGPPAAEDKDFSSETAREIVELVNAERKKSGLQALSLREDLTAAAEIRAEEAAECFSHTRPDGTSCFTVLEDLGISYLAAGENLAAGFDTPERVMEGWMASSSHRENILAPDFEEIGVACFTKDGEKYWVQTFLKE